MSIILLFAGLYVFWNGASFPRNKGTDYYWPLPFYWRVTLLAPTLIQLLSLTRPVTNFMLVVLASRVPWTQKSIAETMELSETIAANKPIIRYNSVLLSRNIAVLHCPRSAYCICCFNTADVGSTSVHFYQTTLTNIQCSSEKSLFSVVSSSR
jgi:hypothetical protein